MADAIDSKSIEATHEGSSPSLGTVKKGVLIIVGPTASGKSALAVILAKKLDGEVISADSRQVYRGLSIGAGKITRKEMQGVKHHLLDVAAPTKVFSAADFVRHGRKALSEIQAQGKMPIICGGTGFYIDALIGRVTLSDAPRNDTLRTKLAKKNTETLFRMLQKAAPEREKNIDSRNSVRLIRALEIALSNKAPKAHHDPPFVEHITWIGLSPNKIDLREKIQRRLRDRVKKGMVAEVRRLHAKGVSWKRLEEFGLEYRYVALYLQNKLTKAEMLTQLEAKIWQYAKRQMTYWRRNKDIKWIDSAEKFLESTK